MILNENVENDGISVKFRDNSLISMEGGHSLQIINPLIACVVGCVLALIGSAVVRVGYYNKFMMSGNKLVALGCGSNSRVFSYGEQSGRVALKVVSSACRQQQGHLRHEFGVLKGLEHEHIIRALRYQEKVAFPGNKMDKQSTHSVLVLEFAQLGSLLAHAASPSLSLSSKITLFAQLLQAVHYLHAQHIAHRDIKLENVLLSLQDQQTCVKLSDFGFASHFQKQGQRITFNQYKGTRRGYMAPEIHACQHSQDSFYEAPPADIFALGVLLFALVMGRLPFELATTDNKLYRLVAERKFGEFWAFHHQVESVFAEEPSRKEGFQRLFERMVSVEPIERPSAQEVLKDDWLA